MDLGETLVRPWAGRGAPGGGFWNPGRALGGPWGDLGETLVRPWGDRGAPGGGFWILLKIGRHFPSKCAKTTIVLFKNKAPGTLPGIPGIPRIPGKWGGQLRLRPPPSTRAGG